jgi:hypothetical protein
MDSTNDNPTAGIPECDVDEIIGKLLLAKTYLYSLII